MSTGLTFGSIATLYGCTNCGQPFAALVTKHTVQALHLVPAAAVTVSFTASAAYLIVQR